MKTDENVDHLIIQKKDFNNMEEALQKASSLIATLMQANYNIITGFSDGVIYIDYCFSGDMLPEFLNIDEYNLIRQYRTNKNTGEEELPN